MSLLCLDFGNTRVKWGLHDAGRWSAQGALMVDELAMLDVRPQRIVACNVAGRLAARAGEQLAERLGVALTWVRAEARRCGVVNGYTNPAQLGADRWAALVGARALHGGACLVVMCGTATTLDVLDDTGHFRGGLILPGLDLMRTALAAGTADLPSAAGGFRPLPLNTLDAIASGGMNATLGAIERMYRNVADLPDPCCLLSGGAAAAVRPHLELPVRLVDNLVLEGLVRLADDR